MVIEGGKDTRNWNTQNMIQNYRFEVRGLEDVESPNDDLRYQAAAKGAAVIARGEGIHMGKN